MNSLDNIERILIIRTDGIGDVLNSTPAISALRKEYQNAYISIVVKPHGAEILSQNPEIDEIILYDPNVDNKSWIDKIKFLISLRSKNYDTAIVLHNSSMSNFMAYASGAKIRVGRKSEPKRFSHTLTHWVSHYDPKGTKHEINRNMDIIDLLKVKNGSHQLRFYLSNDERKYAEKFLHDNGVLNNNAKNSLFRLVGVHPGGSSYDKLWLPENFAEIANRLIGDYNARVIIFGGHDDKGLVQTIAEKTTQPIIDASGVRLRQFASILERCSLFLCNDSGPMHMASALGVPTVAIFGSTDHVRWKPLHRKSKIVRKEMDCWPCSAHKCKKNYECVKSLPVSQVWNAIMELTQDVST